MFLNRLALVLFLGGLIPSAVLAQSDDAGPKTLFLELNAVQDVDGACRLTFFAQNDTGVTIEAAVFETVIFDTSGSVVSLSLFDFRDLPADRPRVRQFDLPGTSCATVGQALINGASSCVVGGAESDLCQSTLSLGSRLPVELLG